MKNRKLLNEKERIEYPAQLFGVHFPFQIEPQIFNTAGRLSPDYTGGYWEMYELSNGGFYMAPDSDSFQVSCQNGFDGRLSGDAFGLTVCLYVYSQLSFSDIHELAATCAEQYHLLREFVFEHPDLGEILAATD